MNKWIAEFELEDGDTMPEHMDLEYKGVKIDFHCRPLSSSEIPNKSEAKIDCNNTYCNNCVNHKYCDYESNKSEIPTSSIAQERYQDLIDYFGNEKVAKTILEDRKEFKAWLERLKWYVKRADELARELEQLKSTTKNDLEVQKAIEIIKADSLASYSVNEIISARDLAVEALKQMQTTKNDLGVDCISRQQAINAFPNLLPNVGYNKKTITEILQDLPSVTPQEPIRPKGKWISYHYGAYYECSNCHERNNSRYDKYCKFCGAKMEGSEEV